MKLSRYKHDSEFSYALGATLVYELLKTQPELIQRVFVRPGISYGEDLAKLIAELKTRHIDILESSKAFNILNAKDNCLLMAEFRKPNTDLEWGTDTPHLVLVNPSDAGNLGTIMRSAVAFGYKNLAIITPAVDPYDPKVIRASMGAVFHLNIQQFPTFDNYQSQYGETDGRKRALYAFMLDQNAKQLQELCLDNSYFALIFGNEASGLPVEFAKIAQPIFIPQSPNVDSLNLSVATSIALYTFRQK